MKTAISLPDELYEDVEQTARAMGIPRSQLFARAVEEYIRRHRRERVTERLNEVYGAADSRDTTNESSDASLESLRELTKNDTW
jgi:metal-responsive CopG/Arc/MetJ family transcriptional regulator